MSYAYLAMIENVANDAAIRNIILNGKRERERDGVYMCVCVCVCVCVGG